jgi:hypothetical protein
MKGRDEGKNKCRNYAKILNARIMAFVFDSKYG